MTPQREAHLEELERLVNEQFGIYDALINRGKGEYGRAGYVTDDTWTRWISVHGVLSTIKRKAHREQE